MGTEETKRPTDIVESEARRRSRITSTGGYISREGRQYDLKLLNQGLEDVFNLAPELTALDETFPDDDVICETTPKKPVTRVGSSVWSLRAVTVAHQSPVVCLRREGQGAVCSFAHRDAIFLANANLGR